ncbi:hypothetical protein [Deinococcus pimensis]|uniref:hypothetical protein n=1 Tax=Deinococcus pimensis TaxID=309888 RepID=UPI000482173C|nr:hypothetical protein [Deinococcus pimensis]
MSKTRILTTALTALVTLAALAHAQGTTGTPGTAAPGTTQNGAPRTAAPAPTAPGVATRDLRREARRLELRNQLQPADRAAFDRLLADRDALARDVAALRQRELRAYVDALRGGAAPGDARRAAQTATLQDRAALQQRANAVREEARALARKYPRLAGLLGGRDVRAGRLAPRGQRAAPAPRTFRIVPDPRGGDRMRVPRDRLGFPRL